MPNAELEYWQQQAIVINPQWLALVGLDNSGPYKQHYPKHPLIEQHEMMVNLHDYQLCSSDWYFLQYHQQQAFYLQPAIDANWLQPTAFLRQSHALRLQQVDRYLRKLGLYLHIQSGWRHRGLQALVIAEVTRQQGADYARRLYADAQQITPHCSGAAFDIELRTVEGDQRLELYYQQQHSPYALELMYQQQPQRHDEYEFMQALRHRRLLHHALCSAWILPAAARFCPHPGECWHFGDGDVLSAYLQNQPYARYGEITNVC